jgi:hypothetical protein
MIGSIIIEAEDEGYIEFNEERGVYEEIDEEGLFMQTLPTDDDRHDSDAEEFRNESKRQDFDAMADAGMSMRDFL